jgi:peptide/nickel transport system permease protein/oligopeptide transport system permease protein
MSESPQVFGPAGGVDAAPGGSLWSDAWATLRRNPVFWACAAIVLAVVSWAVFPGLWTTKEPTDCVLTENKMPPGGDHVFGTTVLGCDMYTHVIYGARPSIVVAVLVTVATALVGGVLGVVAGFFGGWIDTVISRFTDVVLGLPFLLGALVFLALLQTQSIWSLSAVLILLGWTTMTRIVRGTVISMRDREFVQASRAMGASSWWIMRTHVLPHTVSPILVLSTLYVGTYVSAEATLTFLGVGLEPPAISWGVTIAEGQGLAVSGLPHLLVFPGLALVLTVLSFVLLGDVLRDALDPRGRR